MHVPVQMLFVTCICNLVYLWCVGLQREKTLLKEYEQSGKSSVFIDKRIGEQNDELGEFDKAILRSQRERQVIGGSVGFVEN